MALTYNSVILGKVIVMEDGHRRELEIRQGNALGIVIYPYVLNGVVYHQLYTFWADEQHMKNIIKNHGDIFFGKTVDITLNMYHKECRKILEYALKSGHDVTCKYFKD